MKSTSSIGSQPLEGLQRDDLSIDLRIGVIRDRQERLGAHDHVDLRRLAQIAQCESARLLSEADFAELFPDCELGAMPPFGKHQALSEKEIDAIVDYLYTL